MLVQIPRRILLCGVSRSGKSTLGENLRKTFGHHVTAFADPLKQAAQIIFGFKDEDLWGPSHTRETPYPTFEFSGWCLECQGQCLGPERFVPLLQRDDDELVRQAEVKHEHDTKYWYCGCCGAFYPKFVTPREALKTLGTAWGRKFCHAMWPISCFNRMDPSERYVVTDGRFANEVDMGHKKKTCVVLLQRGLAESTSPHPSEAEIRQLALQPERFHIVLHNVDGTPEENFKQLIAEIGALGRDERIEWCEAGEPS